MPILKIKIRTVTEWQSVNSPPTTPGEQIAQQISTTTTSRRGRRTGRPEADFWPRFESMLKGEMENHLVLKSMSAPKTVTMSGTAIHPRRSRPLWAGFYPRRLRIARVPFDRRSSRSTSATFRPSRARYWRCMPGADQRDIALQPSKTSTASRCHMNRSPPSQAASWKRSRHGGIVRSSRSIHLLSSTHLRIAAHGVWRPGWPSMSCLPMTSTARMSLASGSTRRGS